MLIIQYANVACIKQGIHVYLLGHLVDIHRGPDESDKRRGNINKSHAWLISIERNCNDRPFEEKSAAAWLLPERNSIQSTSPEIDKRHK